MHPVPELLGSLKVQWKRGMEFSEEYYPKVKMCCEKVVNENSGTTEWYKK